MSAPQLICSFALSLAVGEAALAQSPEAAQTGKPAEEVQSIKKRASDWLTTCLGDWDAQTHMTKTEWQVTCERVSKEREQFLLNTPGAMSIGTKATR